MKLTLYVIWLFYRKIFLPALFLSLLLALLGSHKIKIFLLSFLLLNLLFHFLIYEIRFKNEYLFYAQFGLSKKILWLGTIGFSILLEFILYSYG